LITPDVFELRDSFDLPGMRIFQFGFGTPQDPFLPHNYVRNCVAYTGTHDNDTVLGWYKGAPRAEQELARQYLNATARNLPWAMIRSLWASVANTVVTPMQDLLSLGTEARMNFPGKLGGNWGWRVLEDQLTDELQAKLLEFNTIYGRLSTK
jgi:4-alpha-glucanotransferase